MKTMIETVTPDRAREILAKNTRNRALRRSVVDRIARDILAGRWHVHHQGIGLAPSFVVDGQHRLHAIILADVPIAVNVTVYDTDEEGEQGLLVVDKNAPRSDADVQTIAGVMSKETARVCVPIVKMLAHHNVFASGAYRTAFSTDEISAFYIAEKEHIDWAVATLFDPEAKSRFSAVHRAAFAAGHVVNPELMDKFAREIVAADESRGKVAMAWGKAVEQGKLSQKNGSSSAKECFLMSLRLVQAELEGTDPPKALRAYTASLDWMKEKIAEVRAKNVVSEAAE